MPTIKFNETGTHIQHGILKVRVDVYPSPTDKTYPIHYVDKPIIPEGGYPGEVDIEGNPINQEDYNNWIASLPTKKELNPCLCHFIKIDPETTRQELEAKIREIFDPETFNRIDNILFEEDRVEKEIRANPEARNLYADLNTLRKELSRLMKSKGGTGRILPYTTDAKKLKEVVNKCYIKANFEAIKAI